MNNIRVLSSSILTALISAAFFIQSGCSNYVVKDFPSKQDYYNSFNSFAEGKTLNIKLTNDSIFTYSNVIFVRNDSLVLKSYSTYRESKTLAVKDIKNINYYSVDFLNPSAYLELKDGENLNAENIKISNDTISFINVASKDKTIPLNEVKNIFYTNRWLGASIGLPIGSFLDAVFLEYGILPPFKSAGWEQYYNQRVSDKIKELLWLPAFGTIIGVIIGYTYTYQFNI